jgi:hypothetical protein
MMAVFAIYLPVLPFSASAAAATQAGLIPARLPLYVAWGVPITLQYIPDTHVFLLKCISGKQKIAEGSFVL